MVFGYSGFFLMKSGPAAPFKPGKEFPEIGLRASPAGWLVGSGFSELGRWRLSSTESTLPHLLAINVSEDGECTSWMSTEKCEHEDRASGRPDRLLQGSNGLKIACLFEPRLFLGTTQWWRGGGGAKRRQINVTLGYVGHSLHPPETTCTRRGWFAFWGTAPPVMTRYENAHLLGAIICLASYLSGVNRKHPWGLNWQSQWTAWAKQCNGDKVMTVAVSVKASQCLVL